MRFRVEATTRTRSEIAIVANSKNCSFLQNIHAFLKVKKYLNLEVIKYLSFVSKEIMLILELCLTKVSFTVSAV